MAVKRGFPKPLVSHLVLPDSGAADQTPPRCRTGTLEFGLMVTAAAQSRPSQASGAWPGPPKGCSGASQKPKLRSSELVREGLRAGGR